MKLLITAGMVIVFISVFFVLFTLNTAVKSGLDCFMGGTCTEGSGYGFTFGIIAIVMFVAIDAIAVYLIVINAMKKPNVYAMFFGS